MARKDNTGHHEKQQAEEKYQQKDHQKQRQIASASNRREKIRLGDPYKSSPKGWAVRFHEDCAFEKVAKKDYVHLPTKAGIFDGRIVRVISAAGFYRMPHLEAVW
jgi:hypothetical protein